MWPCEKFSEAERGSLTLLLDHSMYLQLNLSFRKPPEVILSFIFEKNSAWAFSGKNYFINFFQREIKFVSIKIAENDWKNDKYGIYKHLYRYSLWSNILSTLQNIFLYEIEEYLLSNESRDVDFFFEILKSRRPPGDFQWLYFSLKTLQFCVFCKNKKFQTKIYVREASRKPTEFNIWKKQYLSFYWAKQFHLLNKILVDMPTNIWKVSLLRF